MLRNHSKLLAASAYLAAIAAGLYFSHLQSAGARAQDSQDGQEVDLGSGGGGSEAPPIEPGKCYDPSNGWQEVTTHVQEDHDCVQPVDCFNYTAGCIRNTTHSLEHCRNCDYWRPHGDVYRLGHCEPVHFSTCQRCNPTAQNARMVCASGWEYEDAECKQKCPKDNPCIRIYRSRSGNACKAEKQDPEQPQINP